MNNNTPPTREVDYLQYKGNRVPRFVRLWWTAVIVFSIVYTVKYMLPDLKIWIEMLK